MSKFSYLIFEVQQLSSIVIRKFYSHTYCSENELTVKLVNLNILSTKTRTIPILKNKLSSDTFFDYQYTPDINTHHIKTFYEAYRIIPSEQP